MDDNKVTDVATEKVSTGADAVEAEAQVSQAEAAEVETESAVAEPEQVSTGTDAVEAEAQVEAGAAVEEQSEEAEAGTAEAEENASEGDAADEAEDVAAGEEVEAGAAKSSEQDQTADSQPDEELGNWYVVHTQSGFEAKAKEALEQRIKSLGFSDKIFEIIVPMRDIVTINKGKKRAKKEKVFPGYILVRMILDNDSWIVVRTTQGITGFVGAGTKPTPISAKEVEAIMRFVKLEQPKFKAKFSVGEPVKITDGPLSDSVGTIDAMDESKGKVTVLVEIFGRETPVELDFLQVNKL